eukprot:159478_1
MCTRWSEKGMNQLIKYDRKGMTIQQIHKKFPDRSEGSIRIKLNRVKSKKSNTNSKQHYTPYSTVKYNKNYDWCCSCTTIGGPGAKNLCSHCGERIFHKTCMNKKTQCPFCFWVDGYNNPKIQKQNPKRQWDHIDDIRLQVMIANGMDIGSMADKFIIDKVFIINKAYEKMRNHNKHMFSKTNTYNKVNKRKRRKRKILSKKKSTHDYNLRSKSKKTDNEKDNNLSENDEDELSEEDDDIMRRKYVKQKEYDVSNGNIEQNEEYNEVTPLSFGRDKKRKNRQENIAIISNITSVNLLDLDDENSDDSDIIILNDNIKCEHFVQDIYYSKNKNEPANKKRKISKNESNGNWMKDSNISTWSSNDCLIFFMENEQLKKLRFEEKVRIDGLALKFKEREVDGDTIKRMKEPNWEHFGIKSYKIQMAMVDAVKEKLGLL